MTSLLNTCRWIPAVIHKLDNNRRVYISAFELLHVGLVFSMTVAIELFIILFSIFLDKFQFSTRIY